MSYECDTEDATGKTSESGKQRYVDGIMVINRNEDLAEKKY